MRPVLLPVILSTPAQERQRPGPERVRAQSRAGRAAVRRSAERCGATLGELELDAAGAPRPALGWHWSTTHDATWAAGVVHRAPVGIDLERIEPRRPELVEPVLSDPERELLGEFDWRDFMRVWTAKEAVLKRAGIGLSALSQCRLAAPPAARVVELDFRGARCLVHQTFLSGEHVVSVHTPGSDWSVDWLVHPTRAPAPRAGP